MNYPARLNTTPINPAKRSLSYPATPLSKDISTQPKGCLNLKEAKIKNSEELPEIIASKVKSEEVEPPKFKMIVVTIKIFEFVPKNENDFSIPEGIDPVSTMKISFKVSSEEELSTLKLELNQAESGSVEKSLKESKGNIEITRPTTPTQEDKFNLVHTGKAFSIKKLNITLIGKDPVKESKNIAVFPSPPFTLISVEEGKEEAKTEMDNKLPHTETDDLEGENKQDRASKPDVKKLNETTEEPKKKTESALDFKPTDENKEIHNQNHLEKNKSERIVTSQGASGLSSTCNTPRNFKPLPNFSVPYKK